jgi:hypothetical protein
MIRGRTGGAPLAKKTFEEEREIVKRFGPNM